GPLDYARLERRRRYAVPNSPVPSSNSEAGSGTTVLLSPTVTLSRAKYWPPTKSTRETFEKFAVTNAYDGPIATLPVSPTTTLRASYPTIRIDEGALNDH